MYFKSGVWAYLILQLSEIDSLTFECTLALNVIAFEKATLL